ncbi:MAG: bifunctional DNA-formamidopyrimidine glycosylase/DNA-(apurinic or apyrimidinic site) lyase [Anaplasma sp.]
MPELPEVEVVAKFFAQTAAGRSIGNVAVYRRDLRVRIADDFERTIIGCGIQSVSRVSRYLVFALSAHGWRIVFHLGMSGRITWSELYIPETHDHVVFTLDNGGHMVFNDTRRFGAVLLVNDAQYVALRKGMGPEPLSEEFCAAHLRKVRSKSCIKAVLMNNSVVAGIGNIYASEILFRAGVSPTRLANSLSLEECEKVVREAKSTLKLAINAGGSTIRDYKMPTGVSGGFQKYFAVYGRNGHPCRACGSPILMVKRGGRSTFFCTRCQR